MRSSENRTKVCGWMGHMVGDLRTSSGHGEVWIGVLVRCYTECNITPLFQNHVLCDFASSAQSHCYCIILCHL